MLGIARGRCLGTVVTVGLGTGKQSTTAVGVGASSKRRCQLEASTGSIVGNGMKTLVHQSPGLGTHGTVATGLTIG